MDVWAFETFATDEMGQWMRKYTTPSTATVTESLVRICRGKTIRQRMLLTTEMGAYVTFSHLRKKRLASCGGMSKEIVLRSTFTKESVQGRTKKSPETPKRGGGLYVLLFVSIEESSISSKSHFFLDFLDA